MLEKKYYLCGKCTNIYKKRDIPDMKKYAKVKTPFCCGHPLQIIDKKTKEEIEAREKLLRK